MMAREDDAGRTVPLSLLKFRFYMDGVWCPEPDSNRHFFRNLILSQARLPISPPGQGAVVSYNWSLHGVHVPPVNCNIPKFFANLCKLLLFQK